jgi:hypothetical protein
MCFTQTLCLISSGVFVTNKSKFTRWLRFRQLPMLLSLMLIAVAAMQSFHDQLDHDPLGSAAQCEFCLSSQGAESGLISCVINSPSKFVDPVTEALSPIVLSLARNYSPLARAPPFVFSL